MSRESRQHGQHGSTSRPPLPWDLPRRQALLDAVAALPDPPGPDGPMRPREALGALAGAGLLRECVPAGHGGAAGRVELRALCAVREALAYRDPLYDLMFAMQGLGSYPVTLAGTEAQRRALLPAIASGQAVGAFALTEPQAGSDLSMIATTARRTGDGYVLSGDKAFISNAGLASAYVLFARTGEDPQTGRARLSAFLVPAEVPGLSITPMRLLCGDHPIGALHLREVALPESARIGEEGGGMSLALRTLDHFRASVGAAAVGMARRALDEAVQRTQERVQFGKPLAAHQATQMALGEMAAALEGAALLVERAAYLVDAHPDERATLHSAMAKLQATEVAQQVIDRALQLHGGSGLIEGCVTERLYREIRALRIYEGTSEIQKLVIAREIMQQGRRG
jgi:alkylation response protein AidB-like acyl-CoA dehydrogenase